MDELIQNAHINLLYSEQSTGIKLKLINSLYLGRHCVVNQKMIEGTGLNSLVHIANNTQEMIDKINQLINSSFSSDDVEKRKQILLKNVNNHVNAQKLINLL